MRTSSVASQSSSSGCDGGSPWTPKFSAVFTSPRPKWCCQIRLTLDAGGQRVVRRDEPSRQPEPVARRIGGRPAGTKACPARPRDLVGHGRTGRSSARRSAVASAHVLHHHHRRDGLLVLGLLPSSLSACFLVPYDPGRPRSPGRTRRSASPIVVASAAGSAGARCPASRCRRPSR